MNVISALMEIQKKPVTTDGKTRGARRLGVRPASRRCAARARWSSTAACGSRAARSSTRLPRAAQTIVLEPMTKFPVVRDLVVDRSRMFEDLKRVKAWIDLDGSHELGPGPRQSQENQEEAYPLSRCMTCGCCLEACPQINAVERLHRARGAQPGAPLQPAPERQDARGRAARLGDGRRRRRGVRQGAELRRGLPEGDPARRLDRVRRSRRPRSACSSAGS